MLNARQLIETIRAYCLQNASEANVIKYSYYFKSGYDAYGLSQPTMDAGAKDMLKMPGMNLELVLEAAPELLKSAKYEETGLVLQLVKGFHKQYNRNTFDTISGWYRIGIRNCQYGELVNIYLYILSNKWNVLVCIHE